MAIFNFPIRGEDHASRAIRAARAIQKGWSAEREKLAKTLGVDGRELGVGIGLHSGELSFGEFGRSHRDLTAIGTVVNTASRAQSVADAGQILVTEEVYRRARPDLPASPAKAYRLKGFEAPIELYTA
jgi:class 3 adenylate cyclase